MNETTNTNFTLVIASTTNSRFIPTALFLTQDHTLFIVDSLNFSIHRWNHGKPQGHTVAIGREADGTLDFDPISLSFGLYVDNEYNVYLSEFENHRVTLRTNNNPSTDRVVRITHL